jgi:flagellar biosynthesis protein FliP
MASARTLKLCAPHVPSPQPLSRGERGFAAPLLMLLVLLLGVFALPGLALAQQPATPPAQSAPIELPNLTVARVGDENISLPLQILLVMTAITLLPALVLGVTAFTRIIIVLALLRQALGTGQTPSNQILLGLALFLTALVMMPVGELAWSSGIAPYLDGTLDGRAAFEAAIAPFRAFMFAQVRENDLITFAGLSGSSGYAAPADVPLHVLAAAFLTSELRTAFEIGFLLFIPFVIIDIVISSVLMSMGMMMLSPMLVSAPFKILLFVLVDGWILVVGSLASSFQAI